MTGAATIPVDLGDGHGPRAVQLINYGAGTPIRVHGGVFFDRLVELVDAQVDDVREALRSSGYSIVDELSRAWIVAHALENARVLSLDTYVTVDEVVSPPPVAVTIAPAAPQDVLSDIADNLTADRVRAEIAGVILEADQERRKRADD